jgi:hypothetical protein
MSAPAILPTDPDRPGVVAELRGLGTFGKAWTLTVVALCLVRAVVAWPALVRFGLNPWWFLVLDVGTAPTYGVGQAMAVKILRSKDRPAAAALPWMAMVLVSFLAPYLYVLASAGHLPLYVVGGVLAWMAVFGGLTAARILREVRAAE